MAGTRLALSIVYLIEIPLLVYLAIHYAIQSSKSLKTKWKPSNQPFFPNRHGMKLLQEHNVEQSLSQLRSLMNKALFIDVEIPLRFVKNDDVDIDDDMRELVLSALEEGINMSNGHIANVKFSNVEGLHDELFTTCDDIDVELLLDKNVETKIESDGRHDFFVAFGCEESLLTVGDNGSMLMKFENELSIEEIRSIIKSDVSDTIRQIFHVNSDSAKKKKHAGSRRASRIVMSIVDPDPSSHAANSQDAMKHRTRLEKVLMGALEESLVPMVEVIDQFVNTSISVQSLPYYGYDLSAQSVEHVYDEGSIDYTLSTSLIKNILLNGDLSDIAQGFVSPDMPDDTAEEVIQLMLFLPEGFYTPFYAENGNTWSRAFAVPDRNLAVSIMNLPYEIPQEAPEELEPESELKPADDAALNEYYEYEVQRSLAYLGSFLRRQFGLSPQLSRSGVLHFVGNITVEYTRAQYGIAKWEIDVLMRDWIQVKMEEALVSLERVYELIHFRPMISFPLKVRLYECLYLESLSIAIFQWSQRNLLSDEIVS